MLTFVPTKSELFKNYVSIFVVRNLLHHESYTEKGFVGILINNFFKFLHHPRGSCFSFPH